MTLPLLCRSTLVRAVCIVLLSLYMSACATSHAGPAPGCAPQIITRLYFGLQSPHAKISEPQWQSFLDAQITPRFPAGLTVLAGSGQWRNAQGAIISEDSRIVEIVHPDAADVAVKINAITQLYKSSFSQESVLVLQQPVTACF